jgi:Metal-dependent hydrolases of the beta-lactamase superfamily I
MEFLSLASSSSANAYVLSDGETKILIECGMKYKDLQQSLDFKLSQLDGCIVTHEHKDHSKSVNAVMKNGVPVYMTYGSAYDIPNNERINIIEADKRFTVGTFDILPFDTYHDVDESVGFFIRSVLTGEKMMFATDTINVDKSMDGLDIIAIECNHDKMLMESKKCDLKIDRPDNWDGRIKLLERISNTHMSVDMCERYLSHIDLSNCKQIFLLHMSDNYSNERIFVERIRRVCGDHIEVIACKA